MLLLLAGLLAGQTSLKRICLWGKSLSREAKALLGFKDNLPWTSTLSILLRRIDVAQLENPDGKSSFFSTTERLKR
jgi:hypothetical protein